MQHCPTIGKFDLSLSDLWKVGHRTVRPLDSWKKHSLTIGLLDIQLTSNRTVRHSINQPLDCWTQHFQIFDSLTEHCTTTIAQLFCCLVLWCSREYAEVIKATKFQKSLIPMKKLNETYYKIHCLKYIWITSISCFPPNVIFFLLNI